VSASEAALTLENLGALDVALVGVGREGRATWSQWVKRHPHRPLVLYTEHEPPADFAARLRSGLDELVVGPLNGDSLIRHDVLVRSPGVSPYHGALGQAIAGGARVTTMSSLWFAEHPDARTICVTGTKGKSTTTALVACLLEGAGRRVAMAGNIGRPLFDIDPAGIDWWVIELSSYQLCDLVGRPQLGVLTNLSDEHLDWHAGPDRYRADKLRLARLVEPGGLVANGADAALADALSGVLAEGTDVGSEAVHWFNTPGAPSVEQGGVRLADGRIVHLPPKLRGNHNRDNLAAALAVVQRAGELPEDPEVALAHFVGLPHRLHTIGRTDDGLAFIDDSLSTTPVATLAALEALAGEPVTVLLGGLDRGLDWRAHASAFVRVGPHAVVGLPDSGEAIIRTLADEGLECPGGMHACEDMAEAIARARAVTPRPGIVLLSPGAPSFPRYRDYVARGEDFKHHSGLSS